MSAGPVVLVVDVAEAAVLEPKPWRAEVETRLRGGARMITMFGRPEGSEVVVTAVVQDDAGALATVRMRVDPATGYHALTEQWPFMHCFERELFEQHGVRIAGHPWLKPIRFEHGGPAAHDAYPFYPVEGKEVHEVAVGPIHAGVIEPGSFRFMCLGEQVHHLEIHLGYQHRGVEALLLRRPTRSLAPLVETIAGDTSVAHTWAYAAALEALAGHDVRLDVDAARGVMLELERVAMHLAGLSGLAADVGFLQGATTYGRLRTTAINTSMRLCGSRFGRGAVRPGGLGVRWAEGDGPRDDGAITTAELRSNLELLRHDGAIIDDCFLAARTVRHRLSDVGTLSAERSKELGLVGMTARACGIAIDQRAFGGGVYGEHSVEVVTLPTGDCWARALIRIEEIRRSLGWIERVLGAHREVAPSRQPIGELAPERLVVSMCESWRGEVVHCLETDAAGALVHYKVQDPSFRNWMGLAIAVRENEISDFPICNKSFDLSYCGSDL